MITLCKTSTESIEFPKVRKSTSRREEKKIYYTIPVHNQVIQRFNAFIKYRITRCGTWELKGDSLILTKMDSQLLVLHVVCIMQ